MLNSDRREAEYHSFCLRWRCVIGLKLSKDATQKRQYSTTHYLIEYPLRLSIGEFSMVIIALSVNMFNH